LEELARCDFSNKSLTVLINSWQLCIGRARVFRI